MNGCADQGLLVKTIGCAKESRWIQSISNTIYDQNFGYQSTFSVIWFKLSKRTSGVLVPTC
jgi:hypothetical protein